MCLEARLFIKAAQVHRTACTRVVDQIIILLEMFKSKDIWYLLDVTIYAVLYDRKELTHLFQTQGSFGGKQHQYYISFLNMWISWFCHLREREREREKMKKWINFIIQGEKTQSLFTSSWALTNSTEVTTERQTDTHTAIAETEKDAVQYAH